SGRSHRLPFRAPGRRQRIAAGADLERSIAMRIPMCGAALAAALFAASPILAYHPRSFGQFGFAGAGSMVRPMTNVPGWNSPRSSPSLGGYRGFNPMVGGGIGVPVSQPPFYSLPFYPPPVTVQPPIDTIKIPPPQNVPPVNPPPIR